MANQSPKEQWKIEVNDRYQKVVTSVVSLATAALVLPAFFLKEVFGVSERKPLVDLLNCRAYLSWGFLCTTILCGLVFYYASAKWVKSAWGKPVAMSPNRLECVLDISFWVMVAAFFIGVGCLVWFVATVKVTS